MADLRQFLDSRPPGAEEWAAIDKSVRTVVGAAYAINAEESLRQLRTAFELL
ncbi:MAG: hypothetical protein K8T26_08260 [Lentisphaerae bacterium]|nr:hypothetical protein [Lentisphaerota bacterium]